jgi:hypothetical protein
MLCLVACSAPNIDPKLKLYGLLYSTDTGAAPDPARRQCMAACTAAPVAAHAHLSGWS